MSASVAPPPEGGDQDRGPRFVAVLWVLGVIDILFVAGRFWGRRIIRSTGADDWIMLFTLCLFMVHNGILTFDALHGGQRHLYYMTPQQVSEALRFNWIAQPFMIFGFATGKISVGLLIISLFGSHIVWRKWIVWFFIVSALIFSSLNIILTYVQCDKVEALWEPQLVDQGIAHCWPTYVQTDFAIFLGAWNCLVDAVLALLPVTIFWGLDMSLRQKAGLCLLLGLGFIAAICSAVKTGYLATLNHRSDFTWMTYELFSWSVGELFVIIACGSVPPMKPIYDRYFARAVSSRISQIRRSGGNTDDIAYTGDKQYGSQKYGTGYAPGSKHERTNTEGSGHALSKDEAEIDLEHYTYVRSDDTEESQTRDNLTRYEIWQRDGRFPVGPQTSPPVPTHIGRMRRD